MTDLFVSYSRADRDRVAPIVAALQAEGLSVWWDTRLRAGDHWDEVIEREIKAARCVVVVWSTVSITSQWVKEEARFGLRQGTLVPVRIDEIGVPLGFTSIQTADLIGWSNKDGPQLRQVIDDVRAKLGSLETPTRAKPEPTRKKGLAYTSKANGRSQHVSRPAFPYSEADSRRRTRS